jgi:hypothetical protein
MRPTRLGPTAILVTSPRVRTPVPGRSRPLVPPRTCTTILSPSTSRTCPRRTSPPGVSTSTISLYPTPLAASATSSGPET